MCEEGTAQGVLKRVCTVTPAVSTGDKLGAANDGLRSEDLRERLLAHGTETLLLVDDEEMVLDVGARLLKILGYTVLSARNGKEALRVFASRKDDVALVLLDMIMPDMGGGEVFDRLKELRPDVKVLLASGYGIEGQAGEIVARGCNGFVQKPFDIRRLSKRIREVLDEA